ncbi:hypothetical protein KY385_04105 [Candidatus Parcubacteria bacterium]|nr:hypothetical protein [Candidatus Parcubacteria bacterium]
MSDLVSTILIVGSLASATLAFIWVSLRLGGERKDDGKDTYTSAADAAVEHIFNDEFREELRNRGRLHFEKIIGENAMFLQQDLRLTTSQINEYMKQEITKTLQEAFKKYEESITDAKEVALSSIQKTQASVEEQRQVMEEQLKKAIDLEKKQLLGRFENNMADIVNHYVLSAIGNEISLDDQLEYILAELERNKKDIISDIESGA